MDNSSFINTLGTWNNDTDFDYLFYSFPIFFHNELRRACYFAGSCININSEI